MGRPKGSTTKKPKEDIKIESSEGKEKMECSCCGKSKNLEYFYKSSSRMNTHRKKMSICKVCLLQMCRELINDSKDMQVGVYRTCMYIDAPFLEIPFLSAIEEICVQDELRIDISDDIDSQVKVFQKYMKNINSLNQYDTYTFENGESLDTKSIIVKKEEKEIALNTTSRDKQNEIDVITMLGYDPFDTENIKDRKYLFNRLVDMLDDSTLEDNLLLMSIIEIVKGFNQVDKINEGISLYTTDVIQLTKNNGSIKSLIDTKTNLMKSILKTAEDNGISTKFNTTKSKGSGTLTGIIKKLTDIGLEESKINLYDIETSQAMRQIADTSHSSIMSQLQLNESDYTDMLAQQKDMIYNMDSKLSMLEEENRKLKINMKLKGFDLTSFEDIVDCDFKEIE